MIGRFPHKQRNKNLQIGCILTFLSFYGLLLVLLSQSFTLQVYRAHMNLNNVLQHLVIDKGDTDQQILQPYAELRMIYNKNESLKCKSHEFKM